MSSLWDTLGELVVGLYFYPKVVCVPSDHCIHAHLADFPERFEQKRLLKDWIVEGPFEDEEADTYYFLIRHKSSDTCEECSISSSDFLFDSKAVDKWISRVVARCMEIEFNTSTVSRLMGASQDEVDSIESQETYVVGDYGRGEVEVEVRRAAPAKEDDVKTTPGGIIIP